MPTEKPRVTFTISQEQLAKVDSYRYSNKIKNQTQAILALIESGLADTEGKKAPSVSDEAMKLAKDYDALDTWGRSLLRSVADHELMRKKAETTKNGKVVELPSGVYIHEIASRNGSFTTECMTSGQEEAQDALDDSRPDFPDDL